MALAVRGGGTIEACSALALTGCAMGLARGRVPYPGQAAGARSRPSGEARVGKRGWVPVPGATQILSLLSTQPN